MRSWFSAHNDTSEAVSALNQVRRLFGALNQIGKALSALDPPNPLNQGTGLSVSLSTLVAIAHLRLI